jgi:hypothetical protein
VAEGWMVVNKDTLQQGMNLCFEFICIMPWVTGICGIWCSRILVK